MSEARNTARRFIPTCVGNTISFDAAAVSSAVHPHVCGEHNPQYCRVTPDNGSSPRVWGTRPVPAWLQPSKRFIPTCVGNTFVFRLTHKAEAVHPHVCGEHFYRPPPCGYFRGSSPRVWGTRPLVFLTSGLFRFIPTCVGNTSPDYGIMKARLVHPHVCGEHSIGIPCPIPSRGSSPRVWGTPGFFAEKCGRVRFIPTCVGNT